MSQRFLSALGFSFFPRQKVCQYFLTILGNSSNLSRGAFPNVSLSRTLCRKEFLAAGLAPAPPAVRVKAAAAAQGQGA